MSRYDLGFAPGYREQVVFDDAEGKAHHAYIADNTANLEYTHRRRNDGTDGYGKSRDFREIAHLDAAAILLIYELTGIRAWKKEDTAALLKLLNDPDWKNLRTIDGHVRTNPGW